MKAVVLLSLLLVAALVSGCGTAESPPTPPSPTPVGTARPSSWQDHTYTSDNGRFSVALPGIPQLTYGPITSLAGPLQRHDITLDGVTEAYNVEYIDYPASYVQQFDPQDFLDQAMTQAVNDVKGDLDGASIITLGSYPGRAMQIQVPETGFIQGRIYLVNQRLYELTLLTPDMGSRTNQELWFFGSFQVLAP